MFLTLNQIQEALEYLKPIHPFYGITFLVCKKGDLPVNHEKNFPINTKEKEFLDQYYKPDTESEHYYRVFSVSDKTKSWLSPKYASSTLQSTRTRGDLAEAFIHIKNTDLWGWKPDYVKILSNHLHQKGGGLIPAIHLAVWLYREQEWPLGTAEDIVEKFLKDFSITSDERRELFDTSIPKNVNLATLFQDEKVSWKELKKAIGAPPPPDARPEEGGTLAYLELRGVGPARKLEFEPAERLNLITGDNGLGKTFLLECTWWALTGRWAGLPAYPRRDAKPNEPQITFQIHGEVASADKIPISYDWQTQSWPSRQRYQTIPGLLIYARLDGSFAVWDPVKNYWASSSLGVTEAEVPQVFSRDQVWDGYDARIAGKTTTIINGLLRDWITWQNKPEKYPFNAFKKVLERLSPPTQSDLGVLEPGDPVRLLDDRKEIPTLKHSYREVPVVHAAAGVRRIITIAYLIVWAWEEHKIQSELLRKKPETRMVIVIDEIEAHLHPQWQRRILPALLNVTEDLDLTLRVQFFVATHSPLVMASVEPMFNPKSDKLFHLDIVPRDLMILLTNPMLSYRWAKRQQRIEEINGFFDPEPPKLIRSFQKSVVVSDDITFANSII